MAVDSQLFMEFERMIWESYHIIEGEDHALKHLTPVKEPFPGSSRQPLAFNQIR
jgi:hypothetical protein